MTTINIVCENCGADQGIISMTGIPSILCGDDLSLSDGGIYNYTLKTGRCSECVMDCEECEIAMKHNCEECDYNDCELCKHEFEPV